MKISLENTICEIKTTSIFNKQLKKLVKQNKDLDELIEIIGKLANLEVLDPKYKNHNLTDDKFYKSCSECHIEPDWLLVYQYIDNELILLLVNTGSHSDLFNK